MEAKSQLPYCFLLCDVQEKFSKHALNDATLLETVGKLNQLSMTNNCPLIISEMNIKTFGATSEAILAQIQPKEASVADPAWQAQIYEKTSFSMLPSAVFDQ